MSLIPDLQVQLRDAAAGRRRRARRRVLASLAALATAATLFLALLVAGDEENRVGDRHPAAKPARERPLPVGTVIPKGEGTPPRDAESTIVATGTAPITGSWQLEVWRNHGGPSPAGEPRGRCLFIHPLDPPGAVPGGFSGFCGGLGFRKTPGFSRAQHSVPSAGRRFVKEILVYGRVPERARAVVITPETGPRIEVKPGEGAKTFRGDFFVIPVRPELGPARINWIERDGRPGSRGIRLLPP
jgi:hypothetical protein